MRRLIIAGLLLSTLCLALSLSFPRLAVSTGSLNAISRRPAALTFSPSVSAPQTQPAPATLLRTLVYHEITSLNQSPIAGTGGTSQAVPILSRNGNRAAFALQTGPGEVRLFVINADGSGQREVDSYTNIGGVPLVDISADGSKVLSSAGRRIRLVNADGANPHDVIQFSDGFLQIRLSADGTKVFFTNDRDFSVGSENLTKGLYVINADGSGRRQIVSGANIGTLLSAPPGGNNFVGTSGTTLDVSADTSRILFGTSIDGKGQYLLGVNFDGSGLHQILGPADRFDHAAISGDGLKVAYDIALPPCCSTPNEAGVINFDGAQKKPLLTNTNPFPNGFYPGTGDPMQLSADGSRLFFGTGVLFNTATGEALQLAARGGSFSNDPPFLVNEGMRAATMNGGATRFLYLAPDLNNALQLATLDLNPGSLGAAPNVTDPQIDPTFVITQGRGRATLSARVSATNTLVRVNNSILFKGLTNANAFNGLTDNHVDWLVLLDGGANGDTTVGDGVFTDNRLGADCCAVLGSRLVRVKAEVRASDNKRHATAIDFEPLAVTDQAPSIDVSQTSLDFGSVIIGQSKDLTLTIRNIGNNQLTVNSLSTDNPQFTVPSPTAPFTLAPGEQRTVTVRFTPNAVGPQGGRLTINSTDPARPNMDVFLSGVGIASTSSTCAFTIAPTSQNFPASGGTGSVNVTAQRSSNSLNTPSASANSTTAFISAAQIMTSRAAPITPEDGDWVARTIQLNNTPEADLMARTGDIDNLNFGFPAGFNPFSGNSTPSHSFPWAVDPNDPAGTDRIMVLTSYNGNPPHGQDGYTGATSRPANNVQSIVINYNLNGLAINAARLQMFVDDFQAPVWGAVYQVTLNGTRAPFLEEIINALNQTGPIGKLISVQIPSSFLGLLAGGQLTINIDDKTTGAGDGYAIDFVKLLINPKATAQGGTITGTVTSSATQQPLAGVTVSAGGIVTTQTGNDGQYTLSNVPAGLASVKASRPGYASKTSNVDLVAGQTATVNFALDLAPVIEVSPTNLDFGTVSSGQNKTLDLTVRNTGAGQLSVTTITSDNPVFSVTTATAFTVPAGQQQTVTVRFAPTNNNPQTGTLTINNNDPNRPSVPVSLVGNGGACDWTATSNAPWITITSGTPGQGSGALNYSVAPNTGPARTGTITVAGQTFTVTQDAGTSSCTYSISPTSQSFAAGGGTNSVSVTTQSGCAWTATSNAGFITITSGTPGNGSGTLNYSVAVNTSTSQRSGTLTIAGQTFTVNQSGTTGGAPLIRIEPTTLSFNAARGQSQTSASAQDNQAEPGRATYARNEQEQQREEEGDHVEERRDWFYQQRQYPFDQIPERARERAIAEKMQARERMRLESTEAVAAQWTHIGPSVTTSGAWGRVSGRVTSIIVHPTNPNIVYLSGAQGGVWRTTDNGATWMALTDDQPSLAMGALAFDPNNPSVIYAGTGEQNFSLDSYFGNGVLKSTNGGVTWAALGAATFARQTISRIVVSPSNSQIVFAAANSGLYRSTDGGVTWARVLAGIATDMLAMPGSGSVFYSAIHSSGVFKSTDGGANWTKLTTGLPASNIGRIHLTISVAAPNTLLVSFTARDNKLEGLYRSDDAGGNWTKLTSTPNVFGGQGWYNVSLGLHPTNTNLIYFGGLSLWRSLDGGANWTNVSNPRDYFLDVHPDQHALAFNPQNPSVIWIGNDGGVWRSDNGGETWLSRNDGLSLTQFQTVALHPTNDALAFGGTQDNGIQKYTGNSEWRETRTGDNGSTFFDFNTPTTVYSTYILGSMIKSLSAGEPGTWAGATNGIPFTNGNADGRSAFYAPFTMSPTNPLQLAFGSYRVWYTTDGATNWNAISGDVTGGGVIMAITIAANGSRIWTGSSDAQVWHGDLNGGSWSFTSVTKAPLPNRAITRIAAHPGDPQTAYVSYSGFGTDHVFKTTDGGATWTSANSGLPDIPVNVVLVDPNNPGTVYAGTDIGVYRSTEAGQNWMPFGTGLPNVAVFDLALRKNSNVLRAATHGRGMWEIQAAGEQSFTIYNDGDATLSVTGITKQNNAAWLSFTTPSTLPFDIPPKGSVPVRVAVNATSLNAGLYTERLLVTSSDAARSPYPTGVFINLNVTGDGNGGGCTFTIAPTNQNINASGGTGSVNVTAPNGCTWTAKANEDWITITTGASSSGNGTVNFTVAANTGANPRTGTITIAGQTFTITQTGSSNCAFTLAPTSQSFNASGGTGSVNVTSQSGCNWTAASNADWITITSGASGSGNGTVNYLVAANNTTTTRTGTLTIAGQTFTITQTGGSNCVFTISPTSQTFSASGGSGSINVSTQNDCRWTARTDNDWIVITSGASGNGSGTVAFLVSVNSSPIPRAGFITVAGQTFIVAQAGTGATCGLTPISIGQTVSGALVTTDCRSPIYGEGYYADLWYFTASAGQQVAIQLNSSAFDAYLTLIGPDGEVVDENDDGGIGTNARIPGANGFISLPLDGTYIIEASSAFENELGQYTLSLTAPGGCTFAIAPSSESIAASGGTGSVSVTSQSGCAWAAASNVDWITITSGTSGSGNGTVNYSVAANTSANSRTGTLTIAGQTFTIRQAGGSNCTFTIAPTAQSFNANGGTNSVNVTTQSGCNWTARSNADWITITSNASGSGNGTVNYSVAANNGAARTGTLTIAGQTFTINQSANSSCNYLLSPTSRSFDNQGGSGNVNVTTSAGCAWTATTSAAWISLQTGSESGNGNGSVGYSVAVNNSNATRGGTLTIGGQTFTINQSGGGNTACVDVAISSALLAGAGSTLTVPIMVSDLTGKGALSYDATITFDPTVLRLQSTQVDKNNTLSSALTVTVNTATPGQIRLSAFGAAPLSGAGTLLNLKFDVIGANGSCSNLNWTSFRFNEGTPCATTTNGRACVGSGGSLSGTVSYCVAPKSVPGVLVSANGTPSAAMTTGTSGVFQFTGLGSGAYTLTPAKTGDVNGISSFDAALVALHVVGASTLNSCQQTAGDASNNGALSSFDAALIAQYVVGIANPANFTGTWKFAPPSRSYAALSGEQANQNFDAVLVGDVSGNWSPGAGALPQSLFASSTVNAALQTMVSLPSLSGVKGTTITVPVTVGELTGKNVIAYDFDLTFDPAMLQPLPTPYEIAGTLSSAMTITVNATTGRLRISGFGTTALTGAGVLLNLKFNIIGAGATSALTWQKFALNEETLAQALLTNGSVIVPPANASVSAASYRGPELAAESIVAAFGADLATSVAVASSIPLPTTLAGTTVRVRDSAGVERLAPLFFVAPQQVNYQLPPGTAAGAATITITSGAGAVSTGAVQITNVAAGLFAANADGQGPPAGYAIRVKADGAQVNEPITRFDSTQNKFALTPLDLGPGGEQVFLVLFGTGFRAVSSLSAVSVQIGGVEAQVLYAGAQGGFVGLDQLNLLVPRALSGRGEVEVVVTVDGKTTNTLKLNLK